MTNKLCLCALFILASLNASAKIPLEGNLIIGGPVSIKGLPPPGESHIYINLNKGAAKKHYEALDSVPAYDECTGYMFKGKGNIGYYEVNKGENYYCSFSINTDKSTVEAGMGGC